ncbi:unnamed protein product [Prorocentrum cordatum]|uniref:Uncharacterized protein n=1 Tax=Prorocentrum cordatum TaxID=2364126 RepID=A0ABN9SVZ1_9DINO|nr:unnamed protein product [Polarella glacialis]
MLVDMATPEALSEIHHLTEEVVLASRRLAVMTTGRSARIWEDAITAQNELHPTEAVEQIRFRSSHAGGRAWVKPAILTSKMKKERSKALVEAAPHHRAEYLKLQATLIIQGATSGARHGDPKVIMQKIATTTRQAWKLQEGAGDLQPMEWTAMVDGFGQWLGKVLLQARSQEDIAHLFAEVHGSGIEIDGICHVVEVESNHVRLDGTCMQNMPGEPSRSR